MANRLKDDLVTAGQYGREPQRTVSSYSQLDPDNGVTRPTGTEANKKIRDFCIERMLDAGLTVKIDRIGNIYGRKEGSKVSDGIVMCGSHLDSVVNGGQFDGALGVFSSIEAVRRLTEEHFENERPVEVVVFTGEEGSAFGFSLLGSAALVGKIGMDDALMQKNTSGQTLKDALEAIGYLGDFEKHLDTVDCFVETHIEQGPVLYNEKKAIGIVENIVGYAWVIATIIGQSNHAGTTPMKMRKDALVAAAEIVTAVNRNANDFADTRGSGLVGTVGKLVVYPNGINIVPGKVELSIDIRDVLEENMLMMREKICTFMKELESRFGVTVDIQMSTTNAPAPLSPGVVQVIERSTKQFGMSFKRMNSGAGHDAQNMATKVETGMIFIPSVNGISHAPLEWTTWDDIENGAAVLTQTIKTLSKLDRK